MQFSVTVDPTFLENLVRFPLGLNTGGLMHWESGGGKKHCYQHFLQGLQTTEAFISTIRPPLLLEGTLKQNSFQLAPSTFRTMSKFTTRTNDSSLPELYNYSTRLKITLFHLKLYVPLTMRRTVKDTVLLP